MENLRSASGSVYQKTRLYLGELNDSQHVAWTKALEVFNADAGQTETRSLFPLDRTPPPSATPALSLHLDQYQLSHPRQYGACWLACELWRPLGLDQFWAEKLPASREGTDWARLLRDGQAATAPEVFAVDGDQVIGRRPQLLVLPSNDQRIKAPVVHCGQRALEGAFRRHQVVGGIVGSRRQRKARRWGRVRLRANSAMCRWPMSTPQSLASK